MTGRAILGLLAFALFAFLPVFTVNNTSPGVRTTWSLYAGMIVLLTLVAQFALKKNPATTVDGPYVRHYRRYLLASVCLAFVAAEIISIALTYLTPDRPFLLQTATWLSTLGRIFPVVGKYGTELSFPPGSTELIKTQGIISVTMLAGLVAAFSSIVYFCCMPRVERLNAYFMMESRSPSGRFSDGLMFLGVPFMLLICATALFGWGDFGARGLFEKCVMHAACYVRDDLTLFAAGLMKALALAMIFGCLLFAAAYGSV
jgi:hypothetical protein